MIHKLRKVKVASFKLAYVIGQHKKPLSDCAHYVEFAKSADPNSSIWHVAELVEWLIFLEEGIKSKC